MSPHAEKYLTGAYSIYRHRRQTVSHSTANCHGLIFIPRTQEYLTNQTFDRLVKALRIPLTSSKP